MITINNIGQIAELLDSRWLQANDCLGYQFAVNSCQTPEMLQLLFDYGLRLEKCCDADIYPLIIHCREQRQTNLFEQAHTYQKQRMGRLFERHCSFTVGCAESDLSLLVFTPRYGSKIVQSAS